MLNINRCVSFLNLINNSKNSKNALFFFYFFFRDSIDRRRYLKNRTF